jgi:hypothetical protein
MNQTKNPHWGTTLDTFLGEEGIAETVEAEALTRVTEGVGTTSRSKSRMRREIVEAARGLHKVGAVTGEELDATSQRMREKDAPQ